MRNETPAGTELKSTCSLDCPDACSVLVTVQDGSVVRFRGDPTHPITRGFLCGKVQHYEDLVNSPDRILRPLRRVGRKGSGEFEPIAWSEAIDLVASKIRATVDRHGPEALLLYYYAGTMGNVQRFCAQALYHRLGATRLRANICYYGADAGYEAAVGGGYGVDPEDVVHSDLIVVWGANVATTQVHLLPFFEEARKRGAALWVIDPYRNRTAAMADEWLAVRPGTDTALALGLIHLLELEGKVDRDFLARRAVGTEQFFAEVVARFPPGRVADLTGIPEDRLRKLAESLAAARAPLFKVGIGLGRHSHGAASVWAICGLAGALGAYEKLGGGVLYDAGCEFKPNLDAVKRPDWLPRPTRTMNMTDLGPALTAWEDPRIHFLHVHGSNPAATAPAQRLVLEGLAREDLFTVVHDLFLTDTARFADLILPAVTFVESSDLYKSYGSLYFQFARRVIAPRGEARTNLEVTQAIGKALGFTDPWFDASVEDHVREILRTDHPNFRGIDPERVLAGETMRLNLPRGRSGFADRFRTPSGKLELYSASLAARGLPAMPDYRGDPFNLAPDRYPLRLITPPAHAFLNSGFGALERARKKEGGEPRVMIHPRDAGDLRSGEEVVLSNEQGEVCLVAEVTTDTQPGVLVAEGTWWPSHSRGGGGINVLTSTRLTDLGGGSTFHDNRVALRRAGTAS